MNVFLMFRDRDFDAKQVPPPHAPTLTQDLGLEPLFTAMAAGDEFLLPIVKLAVASSLRDDRATILFRQAVLKDCLQNEIAVRSLYDLAVETIERERHHWFGIFGHYPSSILSGGVELQQLLTEMLVRLRQIADRHAREFQSEGFRTFFARLASELPDEYFAHVTGHLRALRFRDGVLMSARLGRGNEGTDYLLRRPHGRRPNWVRRVFSRQKSAFTFRLDPRDEGGARALSEIRDRGVNQVANAVAQSVEHVLGFFVRLRTELAFYRGCANLHHRLVDQGVPVCFPEPAARGSRRLAGAGLRDVGLVLSTADPVVGNDLDAEGKDLLIVTGANQGGKSTFLRSVGQAQVMMQCGMFVAADSFCADLCPAVFTHFKREEDATMKSGKFDEELARMSALVDALEPDSLVLLNESFAATNDREGSEIARQIVAALREARTRVIYVTHLYEFAHRLWQETAEGVLFLRAERREDGQRTFKVLPGEPLQTSFGADLYRRIFEEPLETAPPLPAKAEAGGPHLTPPQQKAMDQESRSGAVSLLPGNHH